MDFQHKKSLGQHFLNSDHIPKQMCDAADIIPGDLVVEIGPGTGALTAVLLQQGAVVLAIETDNRAIVTLETTFASAIAAGNLKVIKADARKLDLDQLGLTAQKYKVVANIPYYLSGLLFRTFLDSRCQPHTLVFLVQKELAERIARDKKESLLSLSVKAFGIPTYITTVNRGHFTPPPKVDSAIIKVTDINHSYFDTFSQDLFFQVIRAGFGSKRKQLAPNLRQLFPVTTTKSALEEIALPTAVRAEDLSLQDWYQLIVRLQ